MGELDEDERYVGSVSGFSGSSNPIIEDSELDKRIVVVVNNADIERGDVLDCIIQKEHGNHYQALRRRDTPVTKPQRSGEPNVPIHHDGKHGETVGDTRSEQQSYQSVEERKFNPKTHGAPPISRDGDEPAVDLSESETATRSSGKSLQEIAEEICSSRDS